MAKSSFDILIEAVHYGDDGQVEWVRAYERRGPVFSDRTLLRREELIDRIKAGERVVVGKRVPRLAGTFEVSQPVRLISSDGQETLVVGDIQAVVDRLDGTPLL